MTYFTSDELECPVCERSLKYEIGEAWVKDQRGHIVGHGQQRLNETHVYWHWHCDFREPLYVRVLKWVIR
jgi:hypothetical protein